MTLEEGRRWDIEIRFKRRSKRKNFKSMLTIETDDKRIPQLKRELWAALEARVETAPQSLDFDRIKLQEIDADPGLQWQLERGLTIKSQSDDFRITDVNASKSFLALESVPGQRAHSFNIAVKLVRQKLKKGRFRATLTIHTNDPGEFKSIKVPVTGHIL